jgi:hypothetical protein
MIKVERIVKRKWGQQATHLFINGHDKNKKTKTKWTKVFPNF